MASAAGIRDVIALKSKQRVMVPYTPKDNTVQQFTANSATVSYSDGLTFTPMEGGPGIGWTLSTGPGRGASGDLQAAWLKIPFYGDALGLRVYKIAAGGSNSPDDLNIAVKVDRHMYPIERLRARNIEGGPSSQADLHGYVLVDDDLPSLPDGRAHIVEIGLIGDTNSSGPTRKLFLAGLMVDQVTGGYPSARPYGYVVDSLDVPTSLTAIPLTQAGLSDNRARALTKIVYTNTAGTTTDITVNFTGGNGDKQMWKQTLAANGGTAVLDFGRPVVFPTTGTRFRHVASQSGAVATIFGEN